MIGCHQTIQFGKQWKLPWWRLEETRAELYDWREGKRTLLLEERTAALSVTGTAV